MTKLLLLTNKINKKPNKPNNLIKIRNNKITNKILYLKTRLKTYNKIKLNNSNRRSKI